MAISRAWWDRWWAQDYSWEGLAAKQWWGWVRPGVGGPCVEATAGVEGRPATLQDYFIDRLGRDPAPYVSPVSGKAFTRLHLPLAWEDGTPTGKAGVSWGGQAALDNDLSHLLATDEGPREDDHRDEFGDLEVDRRAQLDGAVFGDFNLARLGPPPDPSKDGRIPISLSSRDAAFSGNAWFDNAAFCGNAWFDNVAFSGAAKFWKAAFSGDAEFDNTAFSGGAVFESAAFSGYAEFNDAFFSGDAEFGNAAFSSDAAFGNVAFSGKAGFDRVAFSGQAAFDNASFCKDASFQNAAFSGDAWFEDVAFSGNAEFKHAFFSGDAWFDSAAFSGHAGFKHAAFSGHAGFKHAAFSGDAVFEYAGFSGDARFENAIFIGPANFRGRGEELLLKDRPQVLSLQPPDKERHVAWRGTLITSESPAPRAYRAFQVTNFAGAVFLDDADLSNRDVLTRGDFSDVTFLGLAEFHGSSLHQGVSFDRVWFDAALTTRAEPLRVITPQRDAVLNAGARLLAQWADGRNRTHRASVTWSDARAAFPDHALATPLLKAVLEAPGDKAPGLADRPIAGERRSNNRVAAAYAPVLRKIQARAPQAFQAFVDHRRQAAGKAVPSPEAMNARFDRVEAAFRTLKLAMETNRNRIEEGQFFRLELLARRRRTNVPGWERWASWAYEAVADYGNSLRRPVAALGVSYLLFSLMFFILGAGLDRWAAIATTPQASLSIACQAMVVDNQIADRASAAQVAACRRSLPTEDQARLASVTPAVVGPLNWPDAFAAMTFSWNNIFRPLSALSAEGVAPYEPSWASAVLYGYGSGWGLAVRVLATLQSLFAIVAVFLLALAIRRRFQIN
jgi:hypothetical protein